ncbi:hypothetical protein [Sunxiuqinia dokdonensis]|nr:hypothetical protein [Sunxiuqinia dokdonensis]
MSQVYQLAVQWGQNKSDLFFEDKETTERTAEFVNLMAEYGSTPICIEAIEHKVYSREVAIEHILKGLNFGFFSGPN